MRMRNKKHGAERIAACSDYQITDFEQLKTNPQSFFPTEAPLHLEVGCGKGRFACDMATKYPDINLIAMERIPNVACNALENAKARMTSSEDIKDNLRLIIGNAAKLTDLFPPHSIDVLYLNFSDPWPKAGHAKRRLTYISFLEQYRSLLKPHGILRFKTDNEGLFQFSLEQFEEAKLEVLWKTDDLHHETNDYAIENVMTEYESNFSSKGFPIHMAVVRF